MANTNVDAIKDYVNYSKLGLIGKVFNGADSLKHFNMQAGVKGATALTLLDTTVKFTDGTACGWNPQGSDTFSKRVLTPAIFKVQKEWCPDVLFKTWMSEQLNYAAAGTEMTDAKIAEAIVGQQVTEVSKQLEKAVWQGKVASGDLIDGLVKVIEDTTPTAYEYAAGATISSIVAGVYALIPEDAFSMGDVVLYMGKDMYRKYIQELIANGNLVITNVLNDVAMPESILIPGTNVRVIGVAGLNGSNKCFASFAKNFIYGTDMVEGPETVSFKYDAHDENYHLTIKFVAGVQVAFPTLIVEGKQQA